MKRKTVIKIYRFGGRWQVQVQDVGSIYDMRVTNRRFMAAIEWSARYNLTGRAPRKGSTFNAYQD